MLKKKIDMQCRLSHGSKKLQFNAAESLKIVVLMWRYEIQWSSSAAWFFLRKSFINSLKFTESVRDSLKDFVLCGDVQERTGKRRKQAESERRE